MRYHYTDNTLFIRGRFHAASSGINGGIADVSTILNHTVPIDFSHDEPLGYVNELLEKKRIRQGCVRTFNRGFN